MNLLFVILKGFCDPHFGCVWSRSGPDLSGPAIRTSGPAIRTPTFRRFARIDSQKETCFSGTWPDSREPCLLSGSHANSRDSRTVLAAIHFWRADSQNNGLKKRESIRANRPTKVLI